MNGEAKFLEKLNGLLQFAKDSGSQITIDEVKSFFSEDSLSEEQMDLVIEYLMTQKISVLGYVKVGEEAERQLSEEEQLYLQQYEDELLSIKPEESGERTVLIERILKNDVAAKARFVEIYMNKVIETAKEICPPDMFLGDLIQEGNLGLVIGVDMITSGDDAEEVVLSQMKACMQLLIEEQSELANRDKKMVEKVQALDEAITALTEELGRKVTIDELAVYMGVEIEEIEDILKLAGEDTESDGQE